MHHPFAHRVRLCDPFRIMGRFIALYQQFSCFVVHHSITDSVIPPLSALGFKPGGLCAVWKQPDSSQRRIDSCRGAWTQCFVDPASLQEKYRFCLLRTFNRRFYLPIYPEFLIFTRGPIFAVQTPPLIFPPMLQLISAVYLFPIDCNFLCISLNFAPCS